MGTRTGFSCRNHCFVPSHDFFSHKCDKIDEHGFQRAFLNQEQSQQTKTLNSIKSNLCDTIKGYILGGKYPFEGRGKHRYVNIYNLLISFSRAQYAEETVLCYLLFKKISILKLSKFKS